MKAILVNSTGPADVLEYVECENPTAGPGQLLLKVVVSGVSFGDVMMRQGQYPEMPPFPFIPGTEAAGEVISVGDGVSAEWIGQRAVVVLPGGCNAEFVASPEIFAVRLPDTVSYETAVALGVNYLTAHYVLEKAIGINAGDTVVVYAAAGGVGSALVQLGKRKQLKVIGLASSQVKCGFVSTLGVDHTLCTTDNNLVENIQDLTEGKGVDIILNSVGGESLMADLDMLGVFGQLVLYGMAAGPPSPEFLFKFLGCFNQSISLRLFGMHSVASQSPGAMGVALQELVNLAGSGEIVPKIYSKLPLHEANKAHTMLESREVIGKVVLTVS